MAKILLLVLGPAFYQDEFKRYSEHLVNAWKATYELKYVASNEEAAQLLGENSSIRVALALTSSVADPVKSSGFLQVGGAKGRKVEFMKVLSSVLNFPADADATVSATEHWA